MQGCNLSLAKMYARRCTLLRTGMENVDYHTLKQLTEHCIAFDELNEKDFQKFLPMDQCLSRRANKSVGMVNSSNIYRLWMNAIYLIKDVQPRTFAG